MPHFRRLHIVLTALAVFFTAAPALAQTPAQAPAQAPSQAPAQAPSQAPGPAREPAASPQAAPVPEPAPPATSPQSQAKGPVRPIQAFFAASLCRVPTGVSPEDARRQCYQKTRIKLVNQAAGYVGQLAQRMGYPLSPDEVKAFADSMLTISVVDEDVQNSGGAPRIQMGLEASEDASQVAQKLSSYAENQDLRQKAVSEYRKRAWDAASLGNAGGPSPDQAAERAAEIDRDMRQTEKNAENHVRAGMNFPEVVDILGEPRAVKEGTQGENYMCASYGRIWVVFKNGLASCLRTRLEYHWRHGSDCHCAGNLSTIIPLN